MNRRMRNRMYGGVGGRREQSRPLPDSGLCRICAVRFRYHGT